MIREEGLKHKLINHLIQLQELCMSRKVKEATLPGSRLKQLDESIQAMKSELDPELLTAFDKLSASKTLAIVPISISSCSACGMGLAAHLVNTVRGADSLERCPNCARMLYYPEGYPRGIHQKKKDPTPVTGVVRFSSPALMIPDLKAKTPEAVIEAFASHLEASGWVENGKRLAEEALKREAMMTTAVDKGIAFPHVRGVEGGGLTLSVGISRKGVKFGAGRNLTRIFFFMVIPTAASVFYLTVLSGLTEAFREKDVRDAFMETDDQKEMWKQLIKATKKTIK